MLHNFYLGKIHHSTICILQKWSPSCILTTTQQSKHYYTQEKCSQELRHGHPSQILTELRPKLISNLNNIWSCLSIVTSIWLKKSLFIASISCLNRNMWYVPSYFLKTVETRSCKSYSHYSYPLTFPYNLIRYRDCCHFCSTLCSCGARLLVISFTNHNAVL